MRVWVHHPITNRQQSYLKKKKTKNALESSNVSLPWKKLKIEKQSFTCGQLLHYCAVFTRVRSPTAKTLIYPQAMTHRFLLFLTLSRPRRRRWEITIPKVRRWNVNIKKLIKINQTRLIVVGAEFEQDHQDEVGFWRAGASKNWMMISKVTPQRLLGVPSSLLYLSFVFLTWSMLNSFDCM